MSKKNNNGLIALVGALTTLGPFTVDPYLPSFPKIAAELGADLSTIQLSISAITLGFVIGTVLVGPISDAYGRRKPLLYSAFGYFVATIALAFATNVPLFFAAKVGQGLASSAMFVVCTAIVRDLYSGLKLIKAMGQMFLVGAAAWVIAPTSGSLALLFTDWRGLALLIAVFAGLLLLLAYKVLPETRIVTDKQKVNFGVVFKGFGKVLKDRTFTGLVIVSMCVGVSQFGYIVVFPTVIGTTFQVPPSQIGLYFAANSLCAYVGIQAASWLGRKFSTRWVIAVAIVSGLAIGFVLVSIGAGQANLAAAVFGTFAWLFFFGALFTLVQSLALAHHGEEAGTASALMSSAGYVATTLAGPYFTSLNMRSTEGYGGNILLFMAIALIAYVVIVRPWQMKDLH